MASRAIVKTRSATIKAAIYGEEAERSNVVPYNEDDRFYAITGAIVPPYDPEQLCSLYEKSSNLRPNVEALTTNVDAFGFRLEAAIDLNAPDSDERISDSILIEALFDGTVPNLDNRAVAARRLELQALERIERLRTQLFFDHCCAESSFVELRKRTRTDLEVTGNAYWEVLRNRAGEIAQFAYVPSMTMRLMRSDQFFTEVQAWHRVSAVDFRRVTEYRRFRRFVQYIRGQEVAYFREFGDPRTVSAKTGKFYPDEASFYRSEGKDAITATEIAHFKIHSPLSVYGVPRWVGATCAVAGTRNAEEVNLDYFDSKAVPPFAILVSGGVLAEGAADRIRDYIRDQIKGRENFHSVMVLEAEPAGGGAMTGIQGARVRIEIKNLRDAQNADALFQLYESNNAEKVGAAYRIPKILRGSMLDFNRSTAEAALRYAEQQIFQPERQAFDYMVNQRILTDRGVRFLRFTSNSPIEKDPPVLVEMATKLVDSGIITPNEARMVAADAFNARYDPISSPWARIPPKAAQLGFSPDPTPAEIAAAAARGSSAKPQITLAPTDAAQVVTVNEARAGLSLGPLSTADGKPDPDGFLSLAQFKAKQDATGGAGALPSPAEAPLEVQAQRLVQIRDQLRAAEGYASEAALQEDRRVAAEDVRHVPNEEWNRWFGGTDAEGDEADASTSEGEGQGVTGDAGG
jgi:PBSX family phage portal protein